MEFRILGPVEVWAQGRQVPLAATKQKALLAAGLLAAGRVLSVEQLVDAVWGEQPPHTAAGLVQSYVSALRRVLSRAGAPDVIVTRPPGYLVDVAAGELDLQQAESSLARGRRASADGRHAEAADLLRDALALWRGPVLGGAGDSALLRNEAARLEELRLVVLEQRIAADLELGHEAELVAELTGAVAAHPLRERLRGQLMLALYRLGRQAHALASYQEGRTVLGTELGLDPGPELQRLHGAILNADTSLLRPGAVVGPAPPRPTRLVAVAHPPDPPIGRTVAPIRRPDAPSQLPPVLGELAGRRDQVVTLRQALHGDAGVAVVCVVSGGAGSGKTALVMHAAHGARSAYPDGQLYASLRGPGGDPAEVHAGFLRALGAASDEIPATAAERAALYRSRLAGRRVLIVLDDATGESQVRPLLPGHQGCAVLVGSRSSLVGLEGAVRVEADVLEPQIAVELLAQVAGDGRVLAEPQAAHEITALCGYLPLAVRTAAARLVARGRWPLSVLAARLRDEHRRLDELVVGDLDVRASLASSYRLLTAPQQRAFRLLGALGATDFAPWVVAPLLGVPVPAAENLVEQLTDVRLTNLVGVDAAGQVRYRMHDLTRIYANERAAVEDPAGVPAAAVERVVRCCLGPFDTVATHRRQPRRRPGVARDEPGARLADQLSGNVASCLTAERSMLVAAAAGANGSRAGDSARR